MSTFSHDTLAQIIGGIVVAIVQQLGSSAKSAWARDDEEATVRSMTDQYAHELGDELAEVRILSMGQGKKLETFFVQPSATQLAERSATSADDLQRILAGEDAVEPIDAVSQLLPGARIVLLGPPGAGKSTFLQFTAKMALKGLPAQRLPVFVRLREVAASGLTLFDFISDRFRQCQVPRPEEFLDGALRSGALALLIDGLDEMPGSKVKGITQEIREFSRLGRDALIVVSCRDGVYDGWLPEFGELQLLPFTPAQIRQFVNGWFDGKHHTAARCLAQLERSPTIHAVVSTPLLLALFCISFEANREIAPRKYEFVSDAIDVLLRRWDATREIDRDESPIPGCSASANAYRSLRMGVKQELLAAIAAEDFPDGAGTWSSAVLVSIIERFFSARRFRGIANVVDGTCVLLAMESQHGLIVRRGQMQHGFSHFRFYEYFAAKYVAADEGRITWLLDEAVHDRRWREVVIYVANLARDPDTFVRQFLAVVEARCSPERLAGSIQDVTRRMSAETPYTPVSSRWEWLVYWLMRVAPLATQLDALCGDGRMGPVPGHTRILSSIATACNRWGGARVAPSEFETRFEWSEEAFEPETHTFRQTATPTIRELLLAQHITDTRRATHANSPTPANAVVRTAAESSAHHRGYATIAEMGRNLEEYMRLWGILLESTQAAESLSIETYDTVNRACGRSFSLLTEGTQI